MWERNNADASSTWMLARYTHPTEERKIRALDLDGVEIAKVLKESGGRDWTRTSDLPGVNGVL